jgi:hypothetical protein
MADDTQTYLLREIDPEMWARFKARADTEGISMREAILTLAEGFADGALDIHTTRTAIRATTKRRRARA